MKGKNTSISLVLLLTIGMITIVSFSLGCTDQGKNTSEPVANISEPAANISEPAANISESAVNASEPVANISEPIANASEPVENFSSKPVSSGSSSSESVSSGSGSSGSDSSGDSSQVLEPISVGNITSIKWLWGGYKHSGEDTLVPNPENYTLALFPDGTYYVKAECNSGSGSYTLKENDLTIDTAAMTLAACGPESMDPEYMALLADVKSAAIEGGKLILYSSEGDTMFFTNGGQAEQ